MGCKKVKIQVYKNDLSTKLQLKIQIIKKIMKSLIFLQSKIKSKN